MDMAIPDEFKAFGRPFIRTWPWFIPPGKE